MARANNTAANPVKAAQTTFRIIHALKNLDGAGVTELSDHLDLSKSSVHSYLSTLKEGGYVVQDGETYQVGLRFLELGSYAQRRKKIYDVAKPEVGSLAEETGELANLMVEQHGLGVYLHRAHGEDAVGVDVYSGARIHLHSTALGKAYLSQLPEDRVREIMDTHGMPAETENTVTDVDALLDELAEIREEGIAYDREERLPGARCVAAPIVTNSGDVEGAISVTGPARRMKGERFETEIPELLWNATNVIELNITYTPG